MASTAHHARTDRPLLGLRTKPGRLALWVFRIPLFVYRHGWGRFLGHTFLLLVHVGRRTGREHEAVAMVLAWDPAARAATICSGWGPEADWVRNLRAGPAVRVDVGRDSFVPVHRFLTDEEAIGVVWQFRAQHPRRARFISLVLGWHVDSDETIARFVADRPFVELRPAPEP